MSARLDRQTAFRRAAAPSVDFSLLPMTPEMAELLKEVANRGEAPAGPRAAPQVDRFHARARTPAGTLAPMDVPDAAALTRQDAVRAAVTFVTAHGPTPRRPSEAPTLRLDRRTAARTLEPVDADDGMLEAWAEPDLAFVVAEDTGEDEADAWTRRRSRAGLALGVAALLALTLAVVGLAAGVAVFALNSAPTAGPDLQIEVPAAPTEVSRMFVVRRGDTLTSLLQGTGVDSKAVRAAARGAHDLGKLRVGERVELVSDATTGSPKAVRWSKDSNRTLVVTATADGWSAAWVGTAKAE